jgi:hypothetical protein
VRVTAAAADGLTDLTGGVVRFVGPNVAIVPGVASTNLAIIALTFSGGQNTAQTALTANNISSAPGAAGIYDTFATVKPNPTFASPGVNSTKWKLFNQRVVTFFYNIPTGNASAAFPINAQSGNVTLFRSPNGTESSVVTITMRDQDNRTVVITGETVALSLFKGVTPVNISSASAVPGNPAITLTGPTIRTTTVAGTAFVQDISIFQSAFKTPYVFRALYVNGDAVLSKGIGLTGFFRVLPQFFDIQGGLFAGAGQTAFILNLTESSRGTIRLLNIVSGDNGLGTNQFRVQAFDFVSPGVATPALAYDGPAFLTFEVNASLGAQTDFFKANVPTLTPTNLVGGVLLLSNLTVTASVLSDGFTISAALGILPDQFLSPTPPTLAALLPPTSPFTPPQYLAPTIFVNNGVLDETFFIKKFSRINLGRLRSR